MSGLALLDWRRAVNELYREVRADRDVVRAHGRWQLRRDELFSRHPESPLTDAARASFTGLHYGPYDESLRFEAALDASPDPLEIALETGTDGIVRFRRIGVVHLGDLGTLDVWWLVAYGGGVFLPMRDASETSYPGGRYLLDTVKGADLGGSFDPARGGGTLVIDVNFAYNPSCAYDPRWACPLAPAGNILGVAVEAGERYAAGGPRQA